MVTRILIWVPYLVNISEIASSLEKWKLSALEKVEALESWKVDTIAGERVIKIRGSLIASRYHSIGPGIHSHSSRMKSQRMSTQGI